MIYPFPDCHNTCVSSAVYFTIIFPSASSIPTSILAIVSVLNSSAYLQPRLYAPSQLLPHSPKSSISKKLSEYAGNCTLLLAVHVAFPVYPFTDTSTQIVFPILSLVTVYDPAVPSIVSVLSA